MLEIVKGNVTFTQALARVAAGAVRPYVNGIIADAYAVMLARSNLSHVIVESFRKTRLCPFQTAEDILALAITDTVDGREASALLKRSIDIALNCVRPPGPRGIPPSARPRAYGTEVRGERRPAPPRATLADRESVHSDARLRFGRAGRHRKCSLGQQFWKKMQAPVLKGAFRSWGGVASQFESQEGWRARPSGA